jgi:hypothetical protein
VSRAASIPYFADGRQSPGAVYSYNPVTHVETGIYTRPSGNLYSFLFAPWDSSQLYFVNANENRIYRKSLGGGPEEVVHTHTTYVRSIAVKDGILYFSEAFGAGSDGKIWRLGSGGTPILFYQVRLSDFGFWSGDFAFDKNGVLYLSNGNMTGASLYRVDIAANTVTKIFTDPEPITGMAFGDDGYLYYANWGTKIYRLNLADKTKTTFYAGPTHQMISDVRFKPWVAPVVPPEGVTNWVMPWGVGGIRIDAIKPTGLIDYTEAMSGIKLTGAPFGGHLGFRHGASASIPNPAIKYYRWQYRRAGTGWVDFTEPVYAYYVLEVPNALPTLVPYKLGPNMVAGMNLYEFRPDPSILPKPVPGARTYWVSTGLMFTEYSGYWLTATPDIAPGTYEVRLTVYSPSGSQVMHGSGPFQFAVPDETGPGGEIHTRLALVTEIEAGGFRFGLVIDNRSCLAVIDTPKIGTRVADECGILRYDPAESTPVTIAFRADHPAGFGVFSFSIIRGATSVPTATVNCAEVSAPTAGVYTKNPAGHFESLPLHFTIPELLGPCAEAAFSENLYVYAKATTGNGYRIGAYDASAVRAFALFRKKP